MGYAFSFTSEIVRYLQTIERASEAIRWVSLSPEIEAHLRHQARVRSTHFSTRIEGNRLTLAEAEQVLNEGRIYRGRERDVHEVERYYLALEQVDEWVAKRYPITEERICRLHALLYRGKRARPTPYRDGQNAIRDAAGNLVYLPPEARDVPRLMQELVRWIAVQEALLPVPVIAGISHYQFVTIHPFYDGNGRSARLLATWILDRGGYSLGGFYALEEFYSQDLQGYYEALATHPHHNYYEGRATAEVTSWLAYFLRGMAQVFTQVVQEVQAQAQYPIIDSSWKQKLDRRARRVLGLFIEEETLTSANVARLLGVSDRQARTLLQKWVSQGWIEMADASRRGRKYRLAAGYRL